MKKYTRLKILKYQTKNVMIVECSLSGVRQVRSARRKKPGRRATPRLTPIYYPYFILHTKSRKFHKFCKYLSSLTAWCLLLAKSCSNEAWWKHDVSKDSSFWDRRLRMLHMRSANGVKINRKTRDDQNFAAR